MINKKSLLYFLGFLVACIWGLILMRIYAAVDQDKGRLSGPNKAADTVKTHVPVMQPDTFKLQPAYADPFKELEAQVEAAAVVVSQVATRQVQSFKPMTSPSLVNPLNARYLGYVWNAANKKKVAIINQNGKELMVEEGGLIDGLQLMTISNDSVRVKYKGKMSFIRINR